MAPRNSRRKPRKLVPVIGTWTSDSKQHRYWCHHCGQRFRRWVGPSTPRNEMIQCPHCRQSWMSRGRPSKGDQLLCECGAPLDGQHRLKGCLACQRIVSQASACIEATAGMRDLRMDQLDIYATMADVAAGYAAFFRRPRYDTGRPRVEPTGSAWTHHQTGDETR